MAEFFVTIKEITINIRAMRQVNVKHIRCWSCVLDFMDLSSERNLRVTAHLALVWYADDAIIISLAGNFIGMRNSISISLSNCSNACSQQMNIHLVL